MFDGGMALTGDHLRVEPACGTYAVDVDGESTADLTSPTWLRVLRDRLRVLCLDDPDPPPGSQAGADLIDGVSSTA